MAPLVDTGASLSTIKHDAILSLKEFTQPVTTNIIGTITLIGYMRLNLHNESNESILHNFHVFQTLPVNVDEILGLDFLAKYMYLLNFENNALT